MQVRGLPRQIIRNAAGAARLLDAQTPNIEAARRRDVVTRSRLAMANGLTAEQAAQVVGVPRSTLYRWEKDAAPKSRRPHRGRQKGWTPALRQAVERLRQDFPMWGRAKIGPLVRAKGFAASDATVGRILASLVARASSRLCRPCAVAPTPAARRPSAASQSACRASFRSASRAPSSSSTPSSSTSPRPRRSSISPPTIRSPNGRSARPSTAPPPRPPQASSTRSSPTCPSR